MSSVHNCTLYPNLIHFLDNVDIYVKVLKWHKHFWNLVCYPVNIYINTTAKTITFRDPYLPVQQVRPPRFHKLDLLPEERTSTPVSPGNSHSARVVKFRWNIITITTASETFAIRSRTHLQNSAPLSLRIQGVSEKLSAQTLDACFYVTKLKELSIPIWFNNLNNYTVKQ